MPDAFPGETISFFIQAQDGLLGGSCSFFPGTVRRLVAVFG